ncbi:MAG TPA: thioredoxin family protein, partial [Ilumatobacteraceae bacterium]
MEDQSATLTPRDTLPDGLVLVVKRECETCQMIVPLLRDFAATIYTQDDPSFPPGTDAIHDADLSISWHHDIETVPTLMKIVDGKEIDRTVGWSKSEWRRITGVETLGDGLAEMRPGCGSMSVDPNLADSLRARFSGGALRSRRIELADLDDEMEVLFDRGVTDGLPVTPPTEQRVLRMLDGTTLAADEIVAVVAPDLVEVTVEKIAINAVMAGCLPEYMPWVIAALRAVCTDEFNVHGVLATTMPVGPVLV